MKFKKTADVTFKPVVATKFRPDATKHNADPAYLRGLIAMAGVSQRRAARLIGIDERQLRRYLMENREAESAREIPYPEQFCLECLAANAVDTNIDASKS